MVKKMLKLLSSRMFYLFLGIFLAMTIYVASAAWNTRVNQGEMLTSTLWNDIVAKLEELDSRTSSSGIGSVSYYAIDNGARSIQTRLVNTGFITLSGYLQGASYSNRRLNIGSHAACFSAGHLTGSENHDCFIVKNSTDNNWWIYSNGMGDSVNLACLATCID